MLSIFTMELCNFINGLWWPVGQSEEATLGENTLRNMSRLVFPVQVLKLKLTHKGKAVQTDEKGIDYG